MTELLPRELENMEPLTQVEAFELVIDNELLSEYNWHYHFHLNFWKLGNALGVEGYARCITKFVEIDYFEELEFWNVDFLPGIDIALQRSENPEHLNNLVNALVQAHGINNAVEVDSYVKKLQERIDFVEYKLPLIKTGSFIEIVKKDLSYFEQ